MTGLPSASGDPGEDPVLIATPVPWYTRIHNWLWGYDYFISYHWGSSAVYAVALAEALRSERFEIFLDRFEFAAGDKWQKEAAWAARRTQRLVVVATREAVLSSPPVAFEVERFAKLGRRIISIVFDDSLDDIDAAHNTILKHISTDHTIFIRESAHCLREGPTKLAVERLKKTYDLLRRRTLRLRVVTTTISILAAGLLAVVVLAFALNLARSDAVRRLIEHDLTRGEYHLQSQQFCESLPYFAEVVRLDPQRSESHRLRLAEILRQVPDPVGLFPHDAAVTYSELSRDGRLLLTTDVSGAVVVWSVESASRVAELRHDGPVRHASFNSTATVVVTASDDWTARIWYWKEKKTIVLNHRMEVRRAWFGGDEKEVVTAAVGPLSTESGLSIWDAETGALTEGGSFPVRDAAAAELSPDRTRVAIWTWGVPTKVGFVRITVVDLKAKTSLQIDIKTMVALTSCRFTPDSKWLFITGHGQARLWSAENGAPGTLSTDRQPQAASTSEPIDFGPKVPRDIIHAVLSSDESPVVALAHGDGNVRIFDFGPEPRMIRLLGRIVRIDFNADNRYLQAISGALQEPTTEDALNVALIRSSYSARANVRVFETETTIPVTPPLQHGGGVTSSLFSADSSRLAVTGQDGLAIVWDLASIRDRSQIHDFAINLPDDANSYREMHLSKTRDFVAGNVQWEPSQERSKGVNQVLRWDRNDSFAHAVVIWSADAETLGHFFGDSQWFSINKSHLELIDVRTRTSTWTLANQAADDDMKLLSWDDKVVALGHPDAVYIAPLDGNPWKRIERDSEVASVDVSLSSGIVAFVTNEVVRFISINGEHQKLATVPIPVSVGFQKQGNFNQSGTRFLLNGYGPVALLMDPTSGTVFRLIHNDRIRSASFSADGTRLLTTSSDGTAQVWDAETGATVGKAVWGAGVVDECRFSLNGRLAGLIAAGVGIRLFETKAGDALGPVSWQSLQIEDLFVDDRRVTMLQTDSQRSEWHVVDDELTLGPPVEETFHLIGAVSGYRIDKQGQNKSLNAIERAHQWREWRDLRQIRMTASQH